MALIRLNHFLAAAGAASRRKADEFIAVGKVTVNDLVVTTLGIKVDPEKDKVEVGGKSIKLPRDYVYYAVYKPRGVVATTISQDNEVPVTSLIPPGPSVFPVGRLDKNSEGLMILTNDGDLTYRLTHPKYGVEKTYEVLADRRLQFSELQALAEGVKLEEGITSPAQVRVGKSGGAGVWLTIKIHQGWKRQIRRMLALYTITVRRLIRTEIGPLALSGLTEGQYRRLTREEIDGLKLVVKLKANRYTLGV